MNDMFSTLAGLDIQKIMAALLMVFGALAALIVALYNLFLLIPGDQPDKAIKALYDFTLKFSKKPQQDTSATATPPQTSQLP